MAKFTTAEEIDERENYSKVVLHKQMLLPVNRTQTHMEVDEQRGFVKRRVLEMSNQFADDNAMKTSRSPRLQNRHLRKMSTPEVDRSRSDGAARSKLLLAPRPFRSKSTCDESTPLKLTAFQSESLASSQKVPKTWSPKPIVPPKPRHVSVTPPRRQSTQDCPPSQNADCHDSGVSDETEDTFNDTSVNCSFTTLSQKLDDQKYDLLRRRQSYSEFEDLIEKKRELRQRMLSKIQLLREEREVLSEEKSENDRLGKCTSQKLEKLAHSGEIDKYRQFLEEIEQITKLTVSLTIRLSRLTKKIESGTFQDNERGAHLKKKEQLIDQLNEAEMLHRNTDRRRVQIRQMLAKYLDENDMRDYDNFLNNLIRNITDLKETDQRIQLGEEQLVALNDNLVTLT